MLSSRGKERLKYFVGGILITTFLTMALGGAAWAAASVFQQGEESVVKNSQSVAHLASMELSCDGDYEMGL